MKRILKKILARLSCYVHIVSIIFVFSFYFVVLKLFHRELLKQDIWLIREKPNEARDNGFHFFKYMRTEHTEIPVYYVISEKATDYKNIAEYGNVVQTNGKMHFLLFLSCHYSISSQAYGAYPLQLDQQCLKIVQFFCRKDQKVVFLQHGIIKDELSHYAFDAEKCNIDYFVTSAEREFNFIKGKYGYSGKNIGCTGLCRFDNLTKGVKEENTLLVMPTWRMWLGTSSPTKSATANELNAFENSEFFKKYDELLTSPELLGLLQSKGYKIIFYLHYQIQKYSVLFERFQNENVIIADKEHYDVQTLLLRCKVMITDYSSVYFDFGYMKKPLIYYHFDSERFFSSHYQKGYFSYYDDGFGPVCHTFEELIMAMKEIMDNEAKMPQKYLERVNGFFKYSDNGNCRRTYEDIIKL